MIGCILRADCDGLTSQLLSQLTLTSLHGQICGQLPGRYVLLVQLSGSDGIFQGSLRVAARERRPRQRQPDTRFFLVRPSQRGQPLARLRRLTNLQQTLGQTQLDREPTLVRSHSGSVRAASLLCEQMPELLGSRSEAARSQQAPRQRLSHIWVLLAKLTRRSIGLRGGIEVARRPVGFSQSPVERRLLIEPFDTFDQVVACLLSTAEVQEGLCLGECKSEAPRLARSGRRVVPPSATPRTAPLLDDPKQIVDLRVGGCVLRSRFAKRSLCLGDLPLGQIGLG